MTDTIEYDHETSDAGGVFFATFHGERVGEAPYTRVDAGIISIDHLYVDPKCRGRGVAGKMVLSAVEFARQHQLQVRPNCPVARGIFERTPDYFDVFAER